MNSADLCAHVVSYSYADTSLEIGQIIARQNIKHPVVIMNTSAEHLLASAMLCQEDEYNEGDFNNTASSTSSMQLSSSLSSVSSMHISNLSNTASSTMSMQLSDIASRWLNSSDSVGSDRKYSETSIILASDTSDSNYSRDNSRHDLNLENPVNPSITANSMISLCYVTASDTSDSEDPRDNSISRHHIIAANSTSHLSHFKISALRTPDISKGFTPETLTPTFMKMKLEDTNIHENEARN